MVLEFLSDLAKPPYNLAPSTILAYRNSLRLPIGKAFKVDFKHEDFSLLARAQFLENPPKRQICPKWSLEKALEVLSKKPPIRSLSHQEIFLITLFLIAVASGNRVSELANIDRKAIAFSPGLGSVTLPVMEGFLYKNQSSSRSPPNIAIPALGGNSNLCPVSTLKLYFERTYSGKTQKLFLILSPEAI